MLEQLKRASTIERSSETTAIITDTSINSFPLFYFLSLHYINLFFKCTVINFVRSNFYFVLYSSISVTYIYIFAFKIILNFFNCNVLFKHLFLQFFSHR